MASVASAATASSMPRKQDAPAQMREADETVFEMPDLHVPTLKERLSTLPPDPHMKNAMATGEYAYAVIAHARKQLRPPQGGTNRVCPVQYREGVTCRGCLTKVGGTELFGV